MNLPAGIRRAVATDAAAIATLYAELATDTPVPSLVAAAEWIARCSAHPERDLLVAVDAGRVTGTCLLVIVDNLAHGGAAIGLLENMVVAADRRGDGIGSRLLAAAVRRAADGGCYKLMLSSQRDRDQAHAFYAGRGFRFHGYSFALPLCDHEVHSAEAGG